MPALNDPAPNEPGEWTDLDWSWDELFVGDDIVVDEAVACSLENPESCEARD